MTEVMRAPLYDLAVIGGGINGAGIARDAAGRGLSVALFEARDLASGTSSASTKLIHGGLRYLEHGELSLVRESLTEREVLLRIAPHLIRPLRFVLPWQAGLRPRWMLRVGLLAYDHLGGRKLLPAARAIRLDRHPAGAPLKDGFVHGFEYSDCWADDARLVIANARDAADRGAAVLPRCPVERLERAPHGWTLHTPRGAFAARAAVNAAGPGVARVLDLADEPQTLPLRLVRGSHIVVPALFSHPQPYIFQQADGRIVFAIPYETHFTLIGTTDAEHDGGLNDVHASAEEIAYLCAAVAPYFARPVQPADVVWSYAGVRPLVAGAQGKPEAATRGYRLELSPAAAGAPLLSIHGGKLTTYRRLAEVALTRLAERLPQASAPAWTAGAPLPGGDLDVGEGVGALAVELARDHPFLQPAWALRLARAYGTQARLIVAGARTLADCGRYFGSGLTQRELDWMRSREWAVESDDVLWRRSKLGLHLDARQQAAVSDFLAS